MVVFRRNSVWWSVRNNVRRWFNFGGCPMWIRCRIGLLLILVVGSLSVSSSGGFRLGFSVVLAFGGGFGSCGIVGDVSV